MTDTMFTRFWLEFDIEDALAVPAGVGTGCGVTAFDYFDALKIMDEKVFVDVKRPVFKRVVENVDIRTLDQGHVIPNMIAPVHRGVWFPLGYQ
ncbi:hypothetical protein HNQ91_005981 [Filimonas zeae]|uniref:Uncharacterized protein n=1 Tax=Filimonas zeae TaxID=1737353 RepID=A0A917J7E3_9BACT|nr:hypothetical protein [Filimonas zeae]MDR6342894.1 hypothetical protein [Filimonas zeae]GGH83128.1 hypothetical protein GCM10011379_58050 [Filimonas zeae]